jgi:hypothetical protein
MSDWQRLALGPRGRWLGKDRWPVAGVIAMIAAAVSAWGGMWLEALLFFAAAAVLAVVTVRTRARSDSEDAGPARTDTERIDALASGEHHGMYGSIPPDYVKPDDEGRSRT